VAALAGCGGSSSSTTAELQLQREDLVTVGRALAQVRPSVEREVAITKATWQRVANGLPSEGVAKLRAPVERAAASAAQIELPAPLAEARAVALTGPSSQLAGLYRSFAQLAARGWSLIGAAIDEIEDAPPAAARFARENVGLYIESVYDAHFGLAQIGAKLRDGYARLGGPAAFGASLTAQTVARLAATYSEASDRLYPHSGIRLGS